MGPLPAGMAKVLSRTFFALHSHSRILSHLHSPSLERNVICTNILHNFRLTIGCTSLVRMYSTDDKRDIYELQKHAQILQTVIHKNKEKIRNTEQKLRRRGENLVKDFHHQKQVASLKIKEKKAIVIKDILETKSKVKEKIEEVIERENIYTIPNFLCVARIAMSPYLAYTILQENYQLALGLWLFAGFTDLLDGWIARKWSSQSTKMGSFLDPMADKVLVATLFLSLTWQELIPVSLTCLIVARDVILVGAGFVIRYNSLPPPRTLSRYFDVTHVTAQLAPTFISKVNTAIQLSLVGSTLGAPVFNYVDHPVLQGLWVLTALSTVAAGLSYVVSKNTYKYIKKR
ncbi:cardiolipin synthase [Arctopsyche grandis]|uniref:cardiolipin synthase n=1 Tax=Arctopsyche grandis TaxID=121162 RepID=UPI00406D9AEB